MKANTTPLTLNEVLEGLWDGPVPDEAKYGSKVGIIVSGPDGTEYGIVGVGFGNGELGREFCLTIVPTPPKPERCIKRGTNEYNSLYPYYVVVVEDDVELALINVRTENQQTLLGELLQSRLDEFCEGPADDDPDHEKLLAEVVRRNAEI